MPDPRPFVARSPSRRRTARRGGAPDRRTTGEGQNLPAVIVQPQDRAAETAAPVVEPPASAAAVFAAQMLGQDGQKRGLRGGPETLDKARTSYLGTEWSGHADRRPKAGQITKTEI